MEGETRPPAYIAAVDGIARLDREGQTETAERGVPLVAGDRLRTEGGRVELAFPNGSQVYVDRYTEVELPDPLSLRVARGRLYVRVVSTADAAERLIVDGPGAMVEFQDDGEYRIAIGGTEAAEVELVVLRGQAALSSEGGNVLVPQGHRSVARDGAAPSTPEWSNAGQTTLEKWAADREALWQSGQYASRQYLPAELDGYAATFDRYGTWQNDDTYGSVWYPSNTADDWRPYYDGRWDYTSSYGWTWIAGGDVWAYPTHHYGRWNLGSRGWYWIPSRRWGAAWVYWAVAPDYVGWCPLGWNGRPVLNVFHYDRSYPSRSRDPYRAWTVIPRTSFGRSPVSRVLADRTRLDRDRPAFILQHRSPGVAPPRSPYPSPFNARVNNGRRTTGSDRAARARRRLDDEPAELRRLRQRPRQPRRPRGATGDGVRRERHDHRVAVRAGAALHAAARSHRIADRRRGQHLPSCPRRRLAGPVAERPVAGSPRPRHRSRQRRPRRPGLCRPRLPRPRHAGHVGQSRSRPEPRDERSESRLAPPRRTSRQRQRRRP